MSGGAAPPAAHDGLAARLRRATRALHTEVERSAPMQQLLRSRMQRADYCRLLRSLHVVYTALEEGLARQAAHPVLAALPLSGLARAGALAEDLGLLHGPGWAQALPPVPEALAYAAHLRRLADDAPGRLAAHAYVRYLGDLNGGQALARIVGRSLGLAPGQGVAFYDFGGLAVMQPAIAAFHRGLDACALDEATAQAIVDEAVAGFERHRRLFDELGGTA